MKIQATTVPEDERMDFTHKHFGRHFLTVEMDTYGVMQRICSDYTGGSWDSIELSNGGAYMRWVTEAPNGLEISCENYYHGFMSPDAASITACLYAINKAVWADQENEALADKYYALRDYAIQHEEGQKILAAID